MQCGSAPSHISSCLLTALVFRTLSDDQDEHWEPMVCTEKQVELVLSACFCAAPQTYSIQPGLCLFLSVHGETPKCHATGQCHLCFRTEPGSSEVPTLLQQCPHHCSLPGEAKHRYSRGPGANTSCLGPTSVNLRLSLLTMKIMYAGNIKKRTGLQGSWELWECTAVACRSQNERQQRQNHLEGALVKTASESTDHKER